MVAPALVDGPAVEEADDRHERRVENRHGEHENREQQRRDRRPGDLPARRQPERRQREAEHLAARVAHEDRRRPAPSQVEREKARARQRKRQRERQHGVVRVHRQRVDGEEDGRDPGERRCEPVHVVEQVEGVGEADQPDDGNDVREQVVGDQARDRGAVGDHDSGGCELSAELRDRAEREQVVEQARHEEQAAGAEDRQ